MAHAFPLPIAHLENASLQKRNNLERRTLLSSVKLKVNKETADLVKPPRKLIADLEAEEKAAIAEQEARHAARKAQEEAAVADQVAKKAARDAEELATLTKKKWQAGSCPAWVLQSLLRLSHLRIASAISSVIQI